MKTFRLTIFVFAVFFLIGCLSTTEAELAEKPLGPGQHDGVFKKTITKNLRCNYQLHLPKDYGHEEKKWPMIFFLHGAGGRGDDLRLLDNHQGPSKIIKNHKDFPFIIVFPQCPKDSWWPKQHEVLINLLDEIIQKYDVNERRIYLTGQSMGGFGSWYLGCDYPERFTAIAPICGGGDPLSARYLKNVPVRAYHGAKDYLVPLEKCTLMVDELKKVGGDVRLTLYPEAGHNIVPLVYNDPDYYEWFLKYQKQKDGTITTENPIRLKKELKEFMFFQYIQNVQAFTNIKTAEDDNKLDFSLEIENPLTVNLQVQFEWEKEPESSWMITSEPEKLLIRPGNKGLIRFKAHATDENNLLVLPVCNIKFTALEQNEEGRLRLMLPFDSDSYLIKHRPNLIAKQCNSAPIIDGKIDDSIWQRKPDVFKFIGIEYLPFDRLEYPSVRTEVWFTYDQTNFYVAMRCYEPLIDMLKTDVNKRDGNLWTDDSIEVALDTNRDRKSYYHFMINAAGVIYDAFGLNNSYDTDVKAAVSKDNDGWNVELAIPWANIKVQPPVSGAKMGFLFARTRKTQQEDMAQFLQYPPLNGWNHRKEYYGNLDME